MDGVYDLTEHVSPFWFGQPLSIQNMIVELSTREVLHNNDVVVSGLKSCTGEKNESINCYCLY